MPVKLEELRQIADNLDVALIPAGYNYAAKILREAADEIEASRKRDVGRNVVQEVDGLDGACMVCGKGVKGRIAGECIGPGCDWQDREEYAECGLERGANAATPEIHQPPQ